MPLWPFRVQRISVPTAVVLVLPGACCDLVCTEWLARRSPTLSLCTQPAERVRWVRRLFSGAGPATRHVSDKRTIVPVERAASVPADRAATVPTERDMPYGVRASTDAVLRAQTVTRRGDSQRGPTWMASDEAS